MSLFVVYVFMCSLESNANGDDPKTDRDIFRVTTSGYDSPTTNLTVLEEEPNFGREAAKAAYRSTLENWLRADRLHQGPKSCSS